MKRIRIKKIKKRKKKEPLVEKPKKIKSKTLKKSPRSHLPLKICTEDCSFRKYNGGCYFFKHRRARDKDFCAMDVNKIGILRKAFLTGDSEPVRKEAGLIYGAITCKILEIIEKINADGMVYSAPKINTKTNEPICFTDDNGEYRTIIEYREHPLFRRLTDLCKVVNIDPAEFGLTATSTDKEFQGNIANSNKVDINVVIEEQQKKAEEFVDILEKAGEMRENNPIYKRFKNN